MRRAALVGLTVGCLIPVTGVGFAHASGVHYSYAKVRVTTRAGHKAVATEVFGVTSSGAVAGTIEGPRPDATRAFLKPAHGRPVFVTVKGFPESFVNAASADGTLVVSVFKPRSRNIRTYRRSPSGRLKRFTLPGPDPSGDSVTGINDAGDMVALGFTAKGHSRSFVERHGHWKPFTLKGHAASRTYVQGINDRNTIVGSYAGRHGVTHGFIDRHGRVQVVNLPRAGNEGRGSQVQAISDNGIWVGEAVADDDQAVSIGYVHRPGHALERLGYPKAPVNTFIDCVNDAGEVGGEYTTEQQSTVGFLAKPTP
jgi:hypothetical protein